jgi:ABC-type branched-subunit amino acid transport system permease subunit
VRAGRAEPWRRLGGCLLLAAVAALVTGPSGDADRPLAGVRGSMAGARGVLFLTAAVVAWLGVTCWPSLRGWLRRAPRRAVERAREGAAGMRDRSGRRRRRRDRQSLADALSRPSRQAVPDPAGLPDPAGPSAPAGAPAPCGAPLSPEPPGTAGTAGSGGTITVVAPWHRTWATRSKWMVPIQGGGGRTSRGAVPAQAGPVASRFRRPARRRTAVGYALALAAAVVAPLVVSTAAQQSMVNDIGLYALLALGLNVVVGYAGLLDLGYVAFFAIGAYTAGYLCSATAMPWHAPVRINPFLAMPVAVAVAALAGIALGAPTLRLRGDYLAIVTLGFGEIVQLLANNADGITGGARGVFGVPPLSVRVGGFHYAWGLEPLPYYYLLLVLVIVVMAVLGVWERSRTGRAWAAIRQDEVAAEATGVRTMRMKLLAFAIGASVSGFAGVVLATKQFFNPQTFSLQASLLVLTVVIFGGMGSRLGVVVGAVVLQGLAFFLRDRVPAADRFIYFGAIVMIMMVFRPQGLLPPRPRPLLAGPRPPGRDTARLSPGTRRPTSLTIPGRPDDGDADDEVPTVPREADL